MPNAPVTAPLGSRPTIVQMAHTLPRLSDNALLRLPSGFVRRVAGRTKGDPYKNELPISMETQTVVKERKEVHILPNSQVKPASQAGFFNRIGGDVSGRVGGRDEAACFFEDAYSSCDVPGRRSGLALYSSHVLLLSMRAWRALTTPSSRLPTRCRMRQWLRMRGP